MQVVRPGAKKKVKPNLLLLILYDFKQVENGSCACVTFNGRLAGIHKWRLLF